MSQSLFSQSWYLVADLKVRLRQHTTIHRHIYRDKVWFVLQDHATGNLQRFTPEAYQLIGMLDGSKTLDEIWESACIQLDDHMPTQDEVISMISQLFQANVLLSDTTSDIEDLHDRQQAIQRKKFIQKFKSPLSIKITLIDPEKFLNKTAAYVNPIISFPGFIVWFSVVIIGVLLAGLNWDNLTKNPVNQILMLENVFLIALVYPVVKLFHELGHAYVIKKWGGEVHEMGVMLLLFFPVPYVDGSSASAFRSKYQRMMVGAAGIVVEVFFAALAMIVWSMVEPGIIKAVAFNTMLIAGVSTILFNGNPLLKFDAYYILLDWLEIPNLYTRGSRHFSYLFKKYLYGMKDLASPADSKKEGAWLSTYAVASYIYRLIIMISISLFLATEYFFIGVALAIFAIFTTLVLPIIKILKNYMDDQTLQSIHKRVTSASFIFITVIFLILFVIPVPHSTTVEGVLSVPDQSELRVKAGGFVKIIHAKSGQHVIIGDPILKIDDIDLDAKEKITAAQFIESQGKHQASIHDRVESDINREIMDYLEKEMLNIKKKKESLNINAFRDGTLIILNENNLQGAYVSRGENLGYIIDYDNLPITVLVPEDYIELVRNSTKHIELRFVSDKPSVYEGNILKIHPTATRDVPSRALSLDGGGKIALYSGGKNKNSSNPQSLNLYFHVEIDAPDAPKMRLDERVYVSFTHKLEPIIYRFFRAVRRVFLRTLNV